MAGRQPEGTSDRCEVGEHEQCPHKVGAVVHLFRRSNNAVDILCTCNCHSDCPVGDRREAPDGEWLNDCTCPGSEQLRDIDLSVKHGIDRWKAHQAEVFRDIDIGSGKSPDEIQRQIVSAYRAHGYEPPSDYSRWSRFLSAGTGRRGTRTVRLLVETASGIEAARKTIDSDMLGGDDEGADNRTELRSMRRAFAIYAALAVAAATGSYFTKGFAHLMLMIVTVLLIAVAAWVGLWTVGMGILASVTPGRRGRRRG